MPKDKAPKKAVPAVYQLRITLAQIEPPIWRELHVPADTTLARLHDVIQAAFGWLNYHLHQFRVDDECFGARDPQMPDMHDERKVTLGDLRGAARIVYEYDFGDSWEHVIKIGSAAVQRGGRCCPPRLHRGGSRASARGLRWPVRL